MIHFIMSNQVNVTFLGWRERRMNRKHPPHRGYLRSYLGILGMIVFATLIIIVSTLTFSHTAKKAADETTISLGRFYLEEIADRTVYEISAELERTIDQMQRTADEMKKEHLESKDSLRTYLAMIQCLNGLDVFAVVDEEGMVYTADSTFSGISRFHFLSEPVTETKLYMTGTGQSRAMLLIAAPTAFRRTQWSILCPNPILCDFMC